MKILPVKSRFGEGQKVPTDCDWGLLPLKSLAPFILKTPEKQSFSDWKTYYHRMGVLKKEEDGLPCNNPSGWVPSSPCLWSKRSKTLLETDRWSPETNFEWLTWAKRMRRKIHRQLPSICERRWWPTRWWPVKCWFRSQNKHFDTYLPQTQEFFSFINHLSWLGHHFADVRRTESGMKRVQTMPDIQKSTLSTSEAWLKTSKDTLQQQRFVYIYISSDWTRNGGNFHISHSATIYIYMYSTVLHMGYIWI